MLVKIWLFGVIAASALAASASAQEGAAGDPERGKLLFNRCNSCHRLEVTDNQRLGPHLSGLFSRTVGSLESYTNYSRALTEADFVWSAEKLDEWLAKPNSFLPGNKMPFGGLSLVQDRRDLIAYLQQSTVAD